MLPYGMLKKNWQPQNQQQQNTQANRELWANNNIAFWNHPNYQRMCKYPEPLSYGGDITPQDETRAQPLSQWLTIRDTMDYIVQSYPSFNTISDVLQNQQYLPWYYSAALTPFVLTHFAPLNQANANGQPGQDDDSEFAGIRAVNL